MFKSIGKWFTKDAAPAPHTHARAAGNTVQPRNTQSVQYPPQDPGLTCRSAEDLVAAQAALIGMLGTHAAVQGDLFKTRYLAPITRLASHISNLPGSAQGVFAGEGGLFRASVETAFNSFRASDGRIFTGSSGVEERHLLESRWRYVCFAAGLLYPLGASLQAMQVTDASNVQWSPEMDAISEWAQPGSQYWVTWLDSNAAPGPSPVAGILVHRIVGRENVAWLNEGSTDLMRKAVEIATGSPAAANLIAASVVKDMWSSIHEREMSRRYQNYGRLTIGSHISPYLIDAMVEMSVTKWEINKNVLFADGTGVYLQWPAAGLDIIRHCADRGYRGIPSTDAALLTLLVSNQLIEGQFDGVALTEIATQTGEIVAAVKLSKPGLLVDDPREFAKPGTRPVQMDAVAAADPLVAPSPEKTAPKKPPKKTPPVVSPEANRPTLEELDIGQEEDGNVAPQEAAKATVAAQVNNASPPAVAAPAEPQAISNPGNKSRVNATQEAPATQSPAASKNSPEAAEFPKAAATTPKSKFVEAPAITYSEYVPDEVARKLKPHSVEVLGKVVHAWNNRTDPDVLMRKTQIGAAVSQEFILQISSKGLDAIIDWSSQGMLYIDPARQGMKAHQIAVVEGGQQQQACIVFSNGASKSLGLA